MLEAVGDLWTYPADWRGVTTNGDVRRDGACVMGRGVAKQAALKWPELPFKLGAAIRAGGNVPHLFFAEKIISLPVKHHWPEKADRKLIEESLRYLNGFDADIVSAVVLPRPGCGNGHCQWADVRPICAQVLDNRFTVISLPWEPQPKCWFDGCTADALPTSIGCYYHPAFV